MARSTHKKKPAKRNSHAHAPANTNEPTKATLSRRPLWEGQLRLSLVSCPIAIYSATSHVNDIAFHLLNPRTNNRIRMIPTDPDEGPVERSDLVKGYEIEKNRYVVVTPDELDAVKLETTHALEIERQGDRLAPKSASSRRHAPLCSGLRDESLQQVHARGGTARSTGNSRKRPFSNW